MFLPLTVSAPVVKTNVSPSRWYQIGAAWAKAEHRAKAGANGGNLDGLIDHRGAHVERGRLQSETLKAPPDFHAMGGVIAIG
jgi:hypothetical protein